MHKLNRMQRRSIRRSRRGTMLVVVLGLLVALFVIGTSFSYITLAERKASTNYLDRQRALDLSLDGVEYSIARLRAEATRNHYEQLSDKEFEYEPSQRDVDGPSFGLKTLDSRDVRVSWNKASTNTNAGKDAPDLGWIDFNNNGVIDANETGFGGDKMPGNVRPGSRNFLSGVTLFGGEGIRYDTLPREGRTYEGGKSFGASGTYEDLGDYTRVKVIDAASQLNLNNFKGDRLAEVLMVLGYEIDKWVTPGGKGTGKYNPFTGEVVQAVVKTHQETGHFFTNKEQLRPIWDGSSASKRPELYELAMNFVSVNNWRDPNYRDYIDTAAKVVDDKAKNPRGTRLEMELKREGFAVGPNQAGGQDGWPDAQFDAGTGIRSPVNINTAPKPVLVALFAGIEARARLLYFKKASQISEEDRILKDIFGAAPSRLVLGTPDIGRQNNGSYAHLTEAAMTSSGGENQGIFQLVPIGPITSAAGAGNTQAGGQGGDYAAELAQLVIDLRKAAPFTSWQDFDLRFCYQALLGMKSEGRESIRVGDVVNANRNSIIDPGDPVPNQRWLPLAYNCNHPANSLKYTDAAMSQKAFIAWYWKSTVDMIRAALNPNNVVARYNADYPYHQNVDRMDLVKTTAPVCFSSMGMYEVVSQGEILAPTARGMNTVSQDTTAGGAAQARLPVARRQVRTLVEIYSVLRHSSQFDLMGPIDPDAITNAATSSGTTTTRNIAALTRFGTNSGPYSADERDAGAWGDASTSDTNIFPEDTDYLGVKRKGGYNRRTALSRDFGFITQRTEDRTPIQPMQTGLTFHARFNEGLDARSDTNAGVFGLNSASGKTQPNYAFKPLDKDVVFDDFVNTATPRRVDSALVGGGGPNEFANADKGDEATRYATLQRDGVFLRGSAVRERYRFPGALSQFYGSRGKNRPARLKLLRYPNGANIPNNPFDPIMDGADRDQSQVGYGSDANSVRMRLSGDAAPFSGTDNHNQQLQNHRQTKANCPYYEGTLDFWIKWDFPAQGSDGGGTNPITVCMGEIDPASNNFSGLFGATAYGRSNTLPYSPSAADTSSLSFAPANSGLRNDQCDIEGVQFFIFKEPGGYLRFTRLYFSEAFAQDFPQGVGYGGSQVVKFGNAMRRIIDEGDNGGINQYTGTNDICPKGNPGDKGFIYARTDGWVNLNNLPSTVPALRVHDWHRLTLSWNSNNLTQPYDLWIDGRKIPVEFYPDNNPAQPKGFLNDGHHEPNDGVMVPAEDPAQTTYLFYRTTSRLLEINPEDRLTIGCLFRRQLDISDQNIYNQYYVETQSFANPSTTQSAALFKFDANLVAVANATLDDVRLSQNTLQPSFQADQLACAAGSRYMQRSGVSMGNPDGFFEQGFLPFNPNGASGALLTAPVRLGTLSWTEYRPDFDPYLGQGISLSTSARVVVQWGVFEDVRKIRPSNGLISYADAKAQGIIDDPKGASTGDKDYWARGGISLNGVKLNAGDTVGTLMYRVYFVSPDPTKVPVTNVSAVLDDITLTVLTPPRKLAFVIEY